MNNNPNPKDPDTAKRDTEAKTHPDLVPFDELPQPEKDKDAIFLAFVWLAREFTAQNDATYTAVMEALTPESESWVEGVIPKPPDREGRIKRNQLRASLRQSMAKIFGKQDNSQKEARDEIH